MKEQQKTISVIGTKKTLHEVYELDTSKVPERIHPNEFVTVSCPLHGEYQVKWSRLYKRRTIYPPGCPQCTELKANDFPAALWVKKRYG